VAAALPHRVDARAPQAMITGSARFRPDLAEDAPAW